MKKEINGIQITVASYFSHFNVKAEKSALAENYVNWLVLNSQAGKARLELAKYEADIQAVFPTAIDGALTDELLSRVWTKPEIIAKFHDVLRLVHTLEVEIEDTGITADMFNDLTESDKIWLVMSAHRNLKSVTLSAANFSDDLVNQVALQIQKCYNNASAKDVVEAVRNLFNRLCKSEGQLFYGVSVSRTGLKLINSDLMHFCASFSKGAKTVERKMMDGTVLIRPYSYVLDTSVKTVLANVTELFSVIFDARTNCNGLLVVRDQSEKLETIQPDTTVSQFTGSTAAEIQEKDTAAASQPKPKKSKIKASARPATDEENQAVEKAMAEKVKAETAKNA